MEAVVASASLVEEVPEERLEADVETKEIRSGVTCSIFNATRFAALISLVAFGPAMVLRSPCLSFPWSELSTPRE